MDSKNITVRSLDSSDDDIYVTFLDKVGNSTPSVLAYHYPLYREMLQHIDIGETLYLGAFFGGDLVGVLPGFIKRASVGTVYNSLPYFGPNGGVICGDGCDKVPVHRALLGHVMEFMKAESNPLTASIYTPFLDEDIAIYDECLSNAAVVEKYTQYLTLQDVAWNKKLNYDIRKAANAGIVIDTEVNDGRIDALYKIYEDNCRDFNIPTKPNRCIEYLLTNGLRCGHVRVYFALLDDRIIAGLIVLWGGQTTSYYLPCCHNDFRTLQPNSLLIDSAVTDSKRSGMLYWNWESSPSEESGVYKFKRKWGSQKSRYNVFIKRFATESYLESLGIENIVKHFPYYFAYPFSYLK